MMTKFNNESRIILTRKAKEVIGEDGKKKTYVRREVAQQPIELGSLKNPMNNDILRIECQMNRQNTFENMFKGLFGWKRKINANVEIWSVRIQRDVPTVLKKEQTLGPVDGNNYSQKRPIAINLNSLRNKN